MGPTSTSATSQIPHPIPAETYTLHRQGFRPSLAETAALEFTMFAETLRQDLAPSSLLEHVLTERIVLVSWRLHNVSLGETSVAERGGALPTDSPASRLVASDLSEALSLLQAARTSLFSCGTRISGETTPAPCPDIADATSEANPSHEDEPHDPRSADHSNEWPYIVDEAVQPESESEPELHDDDGVGESTEDMPTRWQDRLVFDFSVSETSPVIKGTWVTVSRVVSLIVDGWTWSDILRAHPELTEDDVRTCLAYTVEQDDHGIY